MASARTKEMVFLRNLYLDVLPRLVIGGILVFTGASKLTIHTTFANLVNSYQLLPLWMGTVYATILPWCELLIGAYLLLGILIRPSAVIAALTAISFMVANVNSIILGEEQCLSCFGEALLTTPLQSLIIDVFIVAVAAYLFVFSRRRQTLGFDSWFAHRQRSRVAISGDA